ncbi:MAG: hypothetical protein K2F87_03825 [Muribaculaceae bacterium]|nr:hypothetical protein [Muribaculaceae bacterium]
MTSLVSGRFRMPQRRMIGYLYSRYGRRWTIGLTVVTVGLAATAVATWDIRWAVCALMVILLIAPVVIAWLYLQFALDPECAFNVLDHRIELQGGGLEVAVWPKRPAPDPESEKESRRRTCRKRLPGKITCKWRMKIFPSLSEESDWRRLVR